MARPARIEYEGDFYHVMHRGNRREDIFPDTCDRENFMNILVTLKKEFYGKEPFVRLKEGNETPKTKDVTYSNFCDIATKVTEIALSSFPLLTTSSKVPQARPYIT